ncbi:Uncharacterized protein dnm_004490 [Desulfonema magnum]|uniref:EGF-like domain-containing protein n=1 Tax=Desulfonema magnum TaxID=45655 RepID=A0A975BFQ4_9BACT|nr:Uncharacterized protein dnm_004490 [Desulfonema magnum]
MFDIRPGTATMFPRRAASRTVGRPSDKTRPCRSQGHLLFPRHCNIRPDFSGATCEHFSDSSVQADLNCHATPYRR